MHSNQMLVCAFARRAALALTLGLVLMALPATAQVSVDCGLGESLQAAVDAAGPGTGITVTGTCTENVFVGRKDDLTIQGPEGGTATLMSADENAGVVISINDSRNFFLRRLVIDGGGQFVDGVDVNNSSGRIFGSTIQNASCGLALFNGSNVILGGPGAGQAVLITNHTDCGVFEGQSIVTLRGAVTIENINGGVGLFAQGGRAQVNGGAVGNTIRDAGTNGIGAFATQGAVMAFNGINTLQNNGDIGMLANMNSTVVFNGTVAPDATPRFTTIEGHAVAGVLVSDSSLNFFAPVAAQHQVRNNGTAPVTSDAGVLGFRTATMRIFGTAVSNNVGPGVFADANSVVDFIDSSITGNSGDGVRLEHLSAARFGGAFTSGESAPANTIITGNGGAALACDATSIAFGDLAGISPTSCKVSPTDKKTGGAAAAASLEAIERRAEEKLNRWLERHRPRE